MKKPNKPALSLTLDQHKYITSLLDRIQSGINAYDETLQAEEYELYEDAFDELSNYINDSYQKASA